MVQRFSNDGQSLKQGGKRPVPIPRVPRFEWISPAECFSRLHGVTSQLRCLKSRFSLETSGGACHFAQTVLVHDRFCVFFRDWARNDVTQDTESSFLCNTFNKRNTMSDEKSSDVEVFVHNKLVVSFACPLCGLEKTIGAEKIKDVYHWNINATCRRCAHKFKVSFNFRKYYRKETYFHGLLFDSFESIDPVGDIIITDISLTGIGFECNKCDFTVGSVLVVRFILDDEGNSRIEKKISIESIRERKVGAVFLDQKGFDKVLGKYILPK
jgi:predicted RNA-binding Zn-ribbon protein involved in translation (DUF1610 family)